MPDKSFDAFQKYIDENSDLYQKDLALQMKEITGGTVPQNTVEIAAAVSYSTCLSILRQYHEWLESNESFSSALS